MSARHDPRSGSRSRRLSRRLGGPQSLGRDLASSSLWYASASRSSAICTRVRLTSRSSATASHRGSAFGAGSGAGLGRGAGALVRRTSQNSASLSRSWSDMIALNRPGLTGCVGAQDLAVREGLLEEIVAGGSVLRPAVVPQELSEFVPGRRSQRAPTGAASRSASSTPSIRRCSSSSASANRRRAAA
jgi:hypothetical protein